MNRYSLVACPSCGGMAHDPVGEGDAHSADLQRLVFPYDNCQLCAEDYWRNRGDLPGRPHGGHAWSLIETLLALMPQDAFDKAVAHAVQMRAGRF